MYTRWPSYPKSQRQDIRITLPVLALAAELPTWLAQIILISSILAAASVYLWPKPLEFPMDDTYIHFVYAENLSEHGGLFFNFPDETGVGTSSLLWDLILAAGNRVGLSMHWLAKLVGIISLVVVGIGLYQLLRPLLSPWAALAGALLVVAAADGRWRGDHR